MTEKDTAAPKVEISGLPERDVRVEDIPHGGVEGQLVAGAKECAAIAQALDLVSLDKLVFDYRLKPLGGGRVALSGLLEAACVQSCVITLDPVSAEISEQVEIEFWPPEELLAVEEQAGEEGAEIPFEGPEPLADGAVALGQIAYEVLASSLDPYPRKEGVSFDWKDTDSEAVEGAGGPFAALEALRKDKKAN
jgi:hypothetical protein